MEFALLVFTVMLLTLLLLLGSFVYESYFTSHKKALWEEFLTVGHTHEGADSESVKVHVERLLHLREAQQRLDRPARLVALALLRPGDVRKLGESEIRKRLSHRGGRLTSIVDRLLILPDFIK